MQKLSWQVIDLDHHNSVQQGVVNSNNNNNNNKILQPKVFFLLKCILRLYKLVIDYICDVVPAQRETPFRLWSPVKEKFVVYFQL